MIKVNKIKKVLIFIFLIGSVIGLVGCTEPNPYEGTWKTTSITVDGVDKTQVYNGELDIELELEVGEEQQEEAASGTGTLTITGLPGKITWGEVEEGLEVTDEMGIKVLFTSTEENVLNFDYNGIMYTLSKVTEE